MGQPSSNVTPQTRMPWLRDDQHSLFLAGLVWLLIVMMIVPDGFDYQSLISTGAPSSGSAISRILWLGLLLFGSVIIFWRAGLAWLLTRGMNPFLLLFVVLAFTSIAWSIDTGLTLRRLLRLSTIVCWCVLHLC